MQVFPGNYGDYLWRKQGGAEKNSNSRRRRGRCSPAEPIPMRRERPAAKRINPIKLQQMQEQAKQLEGQIAELEGEMQTAEILSFGFRRRRRGLAAFESARIAALGTCPGNGRMGRTNPAD